MKKALITSLAALFSLFVGFISYTLLFKEDIGYAALTSVLVMIISLSIISTLRDMEYFKKDVYALKRYKYLLFDLVVRDLKTKYRRSALGILWSVLNPLLMMAVLTAVFSNIMRFEVEGGFALFYLTGYLLFNFISESTNFALQSITTAAPLIKKVFIPKYIFPLEKCIFALVNLIFSLIAFVLVFTGFAISGNATPSFTMLLFPIPLIYIFIFSLGISFILSALIVFFRDIGHLWGVFITMWMYASPIIYPISILPEWFAKIVKLNPLYHFVDYFRSIMIYSTLPSLSENLICILYALASLTLGIVIFRKNQDKFILYI